MYLNAFHIAFPMITLKTGLLVKVIFFQSVIVYLTNTPRNYFGLKLYSKTQEFLHAV